MYDEFSKFGICYLCYFVTLREELLDFFIIHFDQFAVSSDVRTVHRQVRVKVRTFPCHTVTEIKF